MTQYHVTLGGQGLMLDLQSYKRRLAAPWAPKVGDGDRAYGDLAHDQVLALSDWSGGEGWPDYDPANPKRYNASNGGDGYSSPGTLQLAPTAGLVSSLGQAGSAPLCVYAGKLYFGQANGDLVSWDGSSIGFPGSIGASKTPTAMAVYNGKLYIANATDGGVASWDGTTLTAAAFTMTGSPSGVRALCVYGATVPVLYMIGKLTPQGGAVRSWNGSAVSALLFTLQESGGEAMIVMDRKLFLFGADTTAKTGAIYRYDGTSWEYLLAMPDNYASVACLWNGAIYFGTGQGAELWRFDGSAVSQLKALLTTTSGELRGLCVWRAALHALVSSGGAAVVLRWDGSGWFRYPSFGAPTAAWAIAPFAGELDAFISKSGGSELYNLKRGVFTTAAQTVDSGIFSAGLPSVDKTFRSVTITHAALAASQSIQVLYRLEGGTGSFTSLGTNSTTSSTSATFTFNAGTVGKLIELRVSLVGTSSLTPTLYDVTLRYALQADVKREWEFAALTEGTAEAPLITLDGAPDPLTGEGLSAQLWTLRSANGTQTFVDVDGASRAVWFTDLREEYADRSQRRGRSFRSVCRLLEA